MEVILTIVIVVVLCVCLGVEAEVLMIGGACLAVLILLAMFALFTYSIIRVAVSKKYKADFSRIDKNPKGQFNVAYYKIEDSEYPCAFPSEPIMKKRIYNTEKKYTVRLDKRSRNVYDRHASLTCIIGFVFSFAAVMLMVCLFFVAMSM